MGDLRCGGFGLGSGDVLGGGLGLEFGDVRTESAVLRHNLLAGLRVDADHAVTDNGGLDEFLGLGGGQFIGSEVLRNVDATRGLGVVTRRLEVGAVLADTQGDAFGDGDRVDIARVDLTEVVDDGTQAAVGLVTEIEALQPLHTVGFSPGDAVEVGLHVGGELVLDQVGEVLLEQAHHGERDPVGDQRGSARGDIPAVDDRGDRRGEGRGSTDTQLFESFDEACLGVTRGRAGLVTLGLDVDEGENLPLLERRELRFSRLGDLVAVFVLAFLVRGHKATERDDGSGRDELGVRDLRHSAGLGECGTVGAGRGDNNGGGQALGIGHL